MDGSYFGNLRVWPDSTLVVQDAAAPSTESLWPGPHKPAEFARHLFASEALQPQPSDVYPAGAIEPYTLQWFLNIETHRHGRQGRWIPRLLEFAKHSGETLLGLGNGLGTDWAQFARHGAAVVVCSPSAQQLALVRRNFELRGLAGRFLHAAPICLPLESASVDVVCVSGLLHEMPRPQLVVDEIYRVLKPGGKVLAVTAARFDVDFWYRFFFPWVRWLPRATPSPEPAALRFSARSLRLLFDRFDDHRVHKRHLARADVPHVWRWLPRAMLERAMGRILVLKAFKPLSAAIPLQAAG